MVLLPPRVQRPALATALALAAVATAAAAPFRIDSSAPGARPYDGTAGLSGGGATSKLLPSYSAGPRDEIFDALFKPNHIASLNLLKIECAPGPRPAASTSTPTPPAG